MDKYEWSESEGTAGQSQGCDEVVGSPSVGRRAPGWVAYYLASTLPALHATILHLPGTTTVSALFSNLKVGFWSWNVQTSSTRLNVFKWLLAEHLAFDCDASVSEVVLSNCAGGP